MAMLQPERSLARRCPEVAALWHPTKNPGWTPHTISGASDVMVWWGCPAGHQWCESVRDRAALRKWKHRDVSACGICLGFHVLLLCACGEGRYLAKATAPPMKYECHTCSEARNGERLRRLTARTDYVADWAASEALLDPIVPAHLPPALAVTWRCAVRRQVLNAMENELGYGKLGAVGAIDTVLRQLQDEGDRLPTAEELRAAHAAGNPIRFLDRTFWTQGVLHVLGLGPSRRKRDRVSAASLERWMRAGINRVVNRQHPAGTLSTAAMTGILTDLVEQWGQADRTGAWCSHFELTPPFIPSTGRLCGQIDVILTRTGSPDLVVEIDSAHKLRSMEKLCFAHAAGATAVWIRWHSGTARQVPGVHVIDLIAHTRLPKSSRS